MEGDADFVALATWHGAVHLRSLIDSALEHVQILSNVANIIPCPMADLLFNCGLHS